MASFADHISQAKKNLEFLETINAHANDKWDWQVTVCFYTALHLINAHIAQTANTNFLTHNQVESAINPYGMSPGKVDEDTFNSYQSLFNLSRRSRYLLKENFVKGQDIQDATYTYGTHFRKAVHHLNVIIKFMSITHNVVISKVDIKCLELKGMTFESFNVVS